NKPEAQRVAPPTNTSTTPSPTRGSHSMSPSHPEPTVVDSEETLPSPIPNEQNSPSRASEDLGPEEESSKSSKSSKSRSESRMAKEVVDQAEEQVNFQMLQEVTAWWKEARKELKSKHHLKFELKGERFVPSWNISSRSSMLYGEPGQDS
ncbi:UNVERIFIED_CONTAM: hypothetical protein Sindi_0472700, partial [Sesamum indicum]